MNEIKKLAKDIAQNPQRYAKKLKEKLGKIEYLEDWYLSRFVEEEEYLGFKTVNVNNVVGTFHPDYGNLYWSEMLIYGKRMHLNLKLLAQNPFYYLQLDEKEPVMEYLEIDGKIYVYGDGNHRTAIAKVFLPLLGKNTFGKVMLKRWKVNFQAMELEKKAKEKGIFTQVKRVKVSREDREGWHKEKYKLVFITEEGEFSFWEFKERLQNTSIIRRVLRYARLWF